MPGRMLDSNKWKRTRVHEIVDGRTYPYEAKEPWTITGKTYNIENSSQRSASNPCNIGKQIITRPSKEKYGYLPHFHQGLDSSMLGFFGNSEEIEDFLVGGKGNLQGIHSEGSFDLDACSSGKTNENDVDSHPSACSSGKTHDKEIDTSVSSPGHSSLHKKEEVILVMGCWYL